MLVMYRTGNLQAECARTQRGVFMEKIRNYVTEHKKAAVIAMGCAVLLCIVLVFHGYKESEKAPEVTPVHSTTPTALQEYFPNMSKSDAKDTSRLINHAQQQAPTYQYFTNTQAAADRQAQAYASRDKADKLIKTTTEKQVIDSATADSKDNGQSAPQVIQNNYYAIQQQRKHEVKAGAAVIDQKVYGELSYRNRDIEYSVYCDTSGQHYGAGIQYTIAKW